MNSRNDTSRPNVLSQVPLRHQEHPALTVHQPFQLLWEYGKGPEEAFCGDVHYALQISIVLHGQVEVAYEDWNHIFQPGELWWTICWEPHAYRPLARRNLILTINVSLDDLGQLGPVGGTVDWLRPFAVPPVRRYCPQTTAEREHLLEWCHQMSRWYRRRPANWLARCWLAIHELVLRASEQIPPLTSTESTKGIQERLERLHPALALVREQSIPPTLSEAAQACGLSVSRFSELFRMALGRSYGHFALRARLDQCAADLRSGQFVLKEIARRHGFCDASSLCNAFRRVFKCTPMNF